MSSAAGEFFGGVEENARGAGAGSGGRTGRVGGLAPGGSARQMDAWGAVAVPQLSFEDRMDKGTADQCWNTIYSLYGASGEEMRKEVRLACYAYFAVNGTSKFGEYAQEVRLGSGSSVPARDVVKAIGGTRLRQFCRADTSEAYFALKASQVLESDPVASAKARSVGVPTGMAYLIADFLKHCPEFSATEQTIYEQQFERGIMRAGANRGGKSVDDINREADKRMVDAQRSASQFAQGNGDVL